MMGSFDLCNVKCEMEEEDFSRLTVEEVLERKEMLLKCIGIKFANLRRLQKFANQKFGTDVLTREEKKLQLKRKVKTEDKSNEEISPKQQQEAKVELDYSEASPEQQQAKAQQQDPCDVDVKLEATVTKLHQNYQQLENAKKKRRIQVISFIPNQEFHIGTSQSKKPIRPMHSRNRLGYIKCNNRLVTAV